MENKDSQQILPKEELKAKVEKAHQVIHDLCQGKREWIMSIPADRDGDPDLILNDTLMLLEERVKQLEEENTRLKGLLPDCWKSGEIKGDYKACITLSKIKGYEDLHPGEDRYPTFEDWCNKNNIKL